MTCDQLKELTGDNTTLIDVRQPHEYQRARLMGAINLPLSEIENISQYVADDHTLLVYCHSGQRSEYAKTILMQKGYDVKNIGGIIHHPQCIEY